MSTAVAPGKGDEMPILRFVVAQGSDTTLTLTPSGPFVLRGFIAGDARLELVQVRSHFGAERVSCCKLFGGTRVWLLERPLFIAPGSHPVELMFRSPKSGERELELLMSADERSIANSIREPSARVA